MHKEPCCFFGNPKPNCNIACRKALGGGRHLKANKERFAYTEFDFVKQCVCCCRLCMATLITSPGRIGSDLATCVHAFYTLIAFRLSLIHISEPTRLRRI